MTHPLPAPAELGEWRQNAPLARSNWFQVGGAADWLFKPHSGQKLATMLAEKPAETPATILGVGSNLIIRDGGLEGITVRLGREFNHIHASGNQITAGAAVLGRNLALFAADHGISGMEFMIGIPGTLGGIIAMNGGAYGQEAKDVLERVELAMPDGRLIWLPRQELAMRYRQGGLPAGSMVTAAELKGSSGDPTTIHARLAEIANAREATQPIREKTGGSTFKNPENAKAWELIDKAGCRGLHHGGAMVSEKHCNFLINTGNATASDLEELGETVRERVKAATGILLEWEIKRIGRPLVV